jgi:hypothetical protein
MHGEGGRDAGDGEVTTSYAARGYEQEGKEARARMDHNFCSLLLVVAYGIRTQGTKGQCG